MLPSSTLLLLAVDLLRLFADSSAFDCCRLRLVDFGLGGGSAPSLEMAARLAARSSRALIKVNGGGDKQAIVLGTRAVVAGVVGGKERMDV